MPDLFDNFFGKLSSSITGKSSTPHYAHASSVNSGKAFQYHQNATNNKYWLPINKDFSNAAQNIQEAKLDGRKGSVGSLDDNLGDQSRKGSVASDVSDT